MKTKISLLAIAIVAIATVAYSYWALNTPVDLSPGDEKTVTPIVEITDRTPLLNCEDVTNANQYHFQLATDENFSNIVSGEDVSPSVSQRQVAATLSLNSTYYWRVMAVKTTSPIDQSSWSEVYRFKVIEE